MSVDLFTIAFDLGGVIFEKNNDNRFFKKNYMDTTLSVGIHNLIVSLSKNPKIKLIIISKAFPPNAKKSKEILDLYDLTKCFNSIIFCEQNKDKYPIAKAMHVGLMIDDKQEVIELFHDIPYFLYSPQTSYQLEGIISKMISQLSITK